jgi:hypothetical protein
MKQGSYAVHMFVVGLAPFLFATLAPALEATPRNVIGSERIYILAKSTKSDQQMACEAKCKKDYRRCYSQGNKIGTPEVHGGQPCSEQKTTCMRACQDNN